MAQKAICGFGTPGSNSTLYDMWSGFRQLQRICSSFISKELTPGVFKVQPILVDKIVEVGNLCIFQILIEY